MITRPLVPEQKAAYFPADNKLAHDVSAKAGGFVSFVSLPLYAFSKLHLPQ
jgi:hypothetical protein